MTAKIAKAAHLALGQPVKVEVVDGGEVMAGRPVGREII